MIYILCQYVLSFHVWLHRILWWMIGKHHLVDGGDALVNEGGALMDERCFVGEVLCCDGSFDEWGELEVERWEGIPMGGSSKGERKEGERKEGLYLVTCMDTLNVATCICTLHTHLSLVWYSASHSIWYRGLYALYTFLSSILQFASYTIIVIVFCVCCAGLLCHRAAPHFWHP